MRGGGTGGGGRGVHGKQSRPAAHFILLPYPAGDAVHRAPTSVDGRSGGHGETGSAMQRSLPPGSWSQARGHERVAAGSLFKRALKQRGRTKALLNSGEFVNPTGQTLRLWFLGFRVSPKPKTARASGRFVILNTFIIGYLLYYIWLC